MERHVPDSQDRNPSRMVLGALGLGAVALAASLLSVPCQAAPAGFAFLEVPAGARASALGGAYASLADDIEAGFWNPAGLAALRELQITGSHYEFFQHLRHDQFAVGGHVLGGGIAAGLRALYTEPIVERDEIGNEIGTFGAHDLEFSLAFGRVVGGGLEAGGSAQIVRERIARSAATTWSLGGGLAWRPPGWADMRLALAVHHLGPAAHYRLDDGSPGGPVDLPAAVQAGVSHTRSVAGLMLRAALETRLTRGRPGVIMSGAELAHPSGAALRLGVRLNDDANRLGAGVGYAIGGLRLDYAFVPYLLDLGDTHRFSFAARF
jgi:uncharacterized protein UPF0164